MAAVHLYPDYNKNKLFDIGFDRVPEARGHGIGVSATGKIIS